MLGAKVYDSTGASLIATLSESRARNWLDQLNDTGSGSVQIHELDTDLSGAPSLIDYDNIIRCSLDGTDRFAFILENHSLSPAPTNEEAGRWWTLAGRGVLALLDDAVVYPEGPVGQGLPNDRPFGFMSGGYDDSAWTAAVQIQRQDTASGNLPRFWHYPRGWPDRFAWWIWSQALSNVNGGSNSTNSPAGTSYFRKSFTTATDQGVKIFSAALNHFRLWLDGELIVDDLDSDTYSYQTAHGVTRALGAGDHTIVAEVRKDGYTYGQNNHPAGFICSVMEIDDGVLGSFILHTNNTWLALDYPSTVPGMTPGEILRILLEEAQDRGALTGITWDFTDSDDSASAAWDDLPIIGFPIGTSYLDVVRTMVEQHIDIRMSTTLVLSAYNKGTLGSDLTGTVELLVGQDWEQLDANDNETLGGFAHLANVALARWSTGKLVEREDTASTAVRKRKEAYIELGTANTKVQAQNMVDGIFRDTSAPNVQLRGRAVVASGVYSTWTVGDTILAPSMTGPSVDTNIISISMEEDEAGHPIANIEITQDED